MVADPRQPRPDPSRETRLLLLTIAVSAGVLLLLARFRFPDRERTAASAAVPAPALERLAARATYDELAAIVLEVQRRVADSVVVLRVNPAGPEGGRPYRAGPPPDDDRTRFAPAVRVTSDTAMALLAPGTRIGGVVGRGADALLVAADPVSGLALVRIRPSDAEPLELRTTGAVNTPVYTVLVEGTRGGSVVRPVFFGRTDTVEDPRWPGLLLVAGGTLGAQPGSLVFTLDGRFAGIAVVADRSFGLVPAAAVLEAAVRLAKGAPSAGDLGLEVQDLTAALASATGAGHGAVVTYVNPAGPAAKDLRVGDVVESFDGEAIVTGDDLRVRVARSNPDETVRLRVWRRGQPLEVQLVSASERLGPSAPAALGLVLRGVAGVGPEVMRVAPNSAGAAARLLPGDVITHLDGEPAPSPDQVTRLFESLPPTRSATLGIRRGLERFVVALEKR